MTKEDFAKANQIIAELKSMNENLDKVHKMIKLVESGSANHITIQSDGDDGISLSYVSNRAELLDMLDSLNAGFTRKIARMNKEFNNI